MDEAMKMTEETMKVASSSKEGIYLGIAGLLIVGGTFVAGFVTGRATAKDKPKKDKPEAAKEAGETEDEFIAEDDEVFE